MDASAARRTRGIARYFSIQCWRDSLHRRKFIIRGTHADKSGASSMTTPIKIEHAAAWVSDLERASSYYERWFQATRGPKFEHEAAVYILLPVNWLGRTSGTNGKSG